MNRSPMPTPAAALSVPSATLLGLELGAAQCRHAAWWLERITSAWLEGQSAWWRGAESWTEQALRPWFVDRPATAAADRSGLGAFEMQTPAGLLSASLESWNTIGALCLNALRHDVDAPPAPRADRVVGA